MIRRAVPLAPIGAVAFACLSPVAHADVDPHAGMLRYPDVGREHIVFSYAGDLWIVDRDGGTARPLASPVGTELFPRFTPDCESIVFSGNYDGGQDLYRVGINGGVPERITHHPSAEVPCGFDDDGRVVFSAGGIQGNPRAAQLFTVGQEGGLPVKLPVPYGASGAINGDWLAYTPYSRDFRTWKRYRGGMASDIWLFNLATNESRKITDWEGTDTIPMWNGDTLYYLSDRGDGHKLNLWSYDTGDDTHTQVTEYDAYDVKWPSIGPGPAGTGEIVYQVGPGMYLLDLATGKSREVEVAIPGARPTVREKSIDVSNKVQWWNVSATGKRAVVQARGDVWTLPAENGSARNLTRTSDAHEREPAWSPDGRWIAYFSDATGEYELYVTQSDGKGETRRLTDGSETFYTEPVWSPDSKTIAYSDKASQLYLTDAASGETKIVDRDPWGNISRPSWSHDSRWVTYSRALDDKPTPAVFVHDTSSGDTHRVTSPMYPAASPTFDRKGDYLYYASSRNFQPTYSDIDLSFVYNQSQVLIAVPLREDMDVPWPEESDEEAWSEDEDEEEDEESDGDGDEDAHGDEDADAGTDTDEDGADEPVDDGVSGTYEGTLNGAGMPPDLEFVITLTLSGSDITGSVSVPMGTGDISGTYDPATGDTEGTIETEDGTLEFTGSIRNGSLSWTVSMQGQMIELKGTRTSAASDDAGDDDGDPGKDVAAETVEIDLGGFEERCFQLPVPPGNFGTLAVNDKNQLIYTRRSQSGMPSIMLFDIGDDKKTEKTVTKGAGAFEISGDGKTLAISRGGRVALLKASAGATAKNAVTDGMTAHVDPRAEWKQLFVEAWRLQRDFLYVDNTHGVDWKAVRAQYEPMIDDCATREDVSYVIREMISELNVGHAYYRETPEVERGAQVPVGMLGVDWEMSDGAYRIARILQGAAWDLDARNAITRSGIEVGDYVHAVNGVPMDTSKDPWAAFVGTVGQAITLTVSKSPTMDEETRDVVVKPVGNEGNLRYRGWIEQNRAYVDEMTSGKVGYIYVPNTGVDGQNDLVRQYFAQIDKAALIIDERWNGGGQIPSRFIEMLNRPLTNYWARRDANDWKWPPDAHHGPKCMLINGRAGSGGDMFPWLFKKAGLGKLIGTRTWGGLVGISGNPGLIDGGGVTVPTFGFYETDGTWGIEGHGVDPDIEVLDDPALMADGGDPQLDAAISHMMDEIRKNPYEPPSRPAAPDRSGMGLPEKDK